MTRPMSEPPEHDHMAWPHVGAPKSCDLCTDLRWPDDKHLTDAACAAEYWSAMHEHADAVGRSWLYEDPATVNAERVKATRAGDRARTWHRLAAHPHALEEA